MAVHVDMANGQTKTLQEDEGGLGGPKFSPPLYQQRYAAVVEVARRLQAKKVGRKVQLQSVSMYTYMR